MIEFAEQGKHFLTDLAQLRIFLAAISKDGKLNVERANQARARRHFEKVITGRKANNI